MSIHPYKGDRSVMRMETPRRTQRSTAPWHRTYALALVLAALTPLVAAYVPVARQHASVAAASTALLADTREASPLSVVVVPAGVTTVVVGQRVTQRITCEDVLPHSLVRVRLHVLDGATKDATKSATVTPTVIKFATDNKTASVTTTREGEDAPPVVVRMVMATAFTRHQSYAVTFEGHRQGRYYLTYQLEGDTDRYRLSAYSSVISVIAASEGWQGIWYELAVNSILFAVGVLFFAWRRLHRVSLPVWDQHHGGLFERINFDNLAPAAFARRYHEIHGDDVRTRLRRFLHVPCDGAYVCHTCGIPAALLLRFHVDAAHMLTLLSFFSLTVMLPVNCLSGDADSSSPGITFQQTTISNVPLGSNWLWVHVAYCYVIAAVVMIFLLRQYELWSLLLRRTKHIVGDRSILIHHGLPPSTTEHSLRAMLMAYYPEGIEDVTIVFDLNHLHRLLDQRRELSYALDRKRHIEAEFEGGTLSCHLLWCPGSGLAPSPWEVVTAYATCRPCSYYYRHSRGVGCSGKLCCCRNGDEAERSSEPSTRSPYNTIDNGLADAESDDAVAVNALGYELDALPDQVAVEIYEQRRCVGAAFVVFKTKAMRDDFEQLVRNFSCIGRLRNRLNDSAHRLRHGEPRPSFHREPPVVSTVGTTGRGEDSRSTSLAEYLPSIVLSSAPEPDDVDWKQLKYQPFSFGSVVSFVARQISTILLLLLFSTPTAVLVFIKLDSTSGVYRELYAQHSLLVTLVATYLPSLLLIIVNWALLNFLYYSTMAKPSISDTKRTRSFLVKGFIYLVVSSVFLPAIGVTAAYLAFTEINNGKSYVEAFLYKVSGTFFISYVCQRTFLGAITELTRMAERFAYQPWFLARAVTASEKHEVQKPWPYYYGHDYALLLSVLLMILLGTVITPLITLFGALFFYVKATILKYNFLYVIPYTPGRGHIALTAYTILFVCVIIFELVMAFVLLQVGGKKHFIALIVLLGITCLIYILRNVDNHTRATTAVSARDDSSAPLSRDSQSIESYQSRRANKRSSLAHAPSSLDQEQIRLHETYTDPYKVALSLIKLMVATEFHHMTTARSQLRAAFHRLKRNVGHHQRDQGNGNE